MTISSAVVKCAAVWVCVSLVGHEQALAQAAAQPIVPGVILTPPTPQGSVSEQPPVRLTSQQVDDLLGPIALYPDPLVAQILPAATYPLEVVQAARWVREHPDLQGVDDMDWDPSVRAVAHYPTVIKMMDERLEWTIRLGQAFLNQQQDVMDSIQQLRIKARSVGSLRDTPQQQVIVEQEVVRIIPAQPEVIYVPAYNPQVVYVEPAWGYAVTPYITFGIGFSLGWWLDLDCDWHHHNVYYRNWHPHHFDGDPFPHGPGYPHGRPGAIARPGREGEMWRRDPHRGYPPVVGSHGNRPGRPSEGARGRLTPGGPGLPGQAVPGRGPGQARPTPGTGRLPSQAPGARPGPTPRPGTAPSPGARPGMPPRSNPVAPPGQITRPTQPAMPARPAPSSLGGYQRGTQAQLNSQRGQSSRGVGPTLPAPRPSVAPRTAPRTFTPSRPMPAPRATPGALGGYQSGRDARVNSQRGSASRGGRRP